MYTKIKYKFEYIDAVFIDPTLDITTESDYIYNKTLVDNNLLTLEESCLKLKEDGKWSDQLQKELEDLEKHNISLSKQLPNLKYHKKHERSVKEGIKKNRSRIQYLERIKWQLWPMTKEYYSLQSKRAFIIRKITTFPTLSEEENNDIFYNLEFLSLLVATYFDINNIPTSIIRELARSDPWRLYWILSKNNGTPLFSHSSVEMTDYQYQLVLWSKIYDMAFESNNRPGDDVIEDDEKFDSWNQAERKRINEQIKEGDKQLTMGGENYIPCDEEGAAEVFKLNDVISRANIHNRQKLIESKEEVKEAELPDIKTEIKIAQNRLNMQT